MSSSCHCDWVALQPHGFFSQYVSSLSFLAVFLGQMQTSSGMFHCSSSSCCLSDWELFAVLMQSDSHFRTECATVGLWSILIWGIFFKLSLASCLHKSGEGYSCDDHSSVWNSNGQSLLFMSRASGVFTFCPWFFSFFNWVYILVFQYLVYSFCLKFVLSCFVIP